MNGVIFDFNGTLYWDTEYQNSSWDEYLKTVNVSLTTEEKSKHIHGRNGKDAFEYIFKKELTKKDVEILTEEKEVYYRKECLLHKMELAPGAERLLAELIEKDIKIAIATASGKTNVDFFIKEFNLLKYFKVENIIYNDGTTKGKPDPDLFNRAIDSLGINKENTTIFEDSAAGIEAAKRADVQEVIVVNSTQQIQNSYKLKMINHFDQFDR